MRYQERGESYYVPGTGETLVRLPTIASPVPGTITPKLGHTRDCAHVGMITVGSMAMAKQQMWRGTLFNDHLVDNLLKAHPGRGQACLGHGANPRLLKIVAGVPADGDDAIVAGYRELAHIKEAVIGQRGDDAVVDLLVIKAWRKEGYAHHGSLGRNNGRMDQESTPKR